MTRRVLIAHYNDDLSGQLRLLLISRGIDVCIVSTGLDCLARLRDWHPDLLVVSPNLTWGTGVSVLVLLHEEVDLVPIPTVVLADDTENLADYVRPEWIQQMFRDPVVPLSVSMSICSMLNHNQTGKMAMESDLQVSASTMQQHLTKNNSKGDLRCSVTHSLTPGYSSSAQLCATQNRVCRFSVATQGSK